jgi:8-oxo-dGTP pyrophosphatase MutT (NUDIX family)
MGSVNWKDRCWVATVYLVWKDRVLLHKNPRLGLYVPIGGHVEPGQTPDEAVANEVREEANMEIEFLNNGKTKGENDQVWMPPQPHHIQYEMTPHHGLHMNLTYFAVPKNPSEINSIIGEEDCGEELRWVSLNEMVGKEFPENVRADSAMAVREAKDFLQRKK